MGWFRRSVRKFSAAESFRLFMEGIRFLQLYDDEANRGEGVEEALLNRLLNDAERFFRQCTEIYSKDLLPRYYLGIVLSVRGQVEQARRLRAEIDGKALGPVLDPDTLFVEAARIFRETAQLVGGGDLLAYAQYNRAQALAKTAPLKAVEKL